MKKTITLFIGCSMLLTAAAQITMGGWMMHYSYNQVTRIEESSDKVYALCQGSLYATDKRDGEITYYNKLTGLNGASISIIKYAKEEQALVILYEDGNIDMLYDDGYVENIADLYITQTSVNKQANDIIVSGNKAYLAMNFGIIAVSLSHKEISDTYYIGDNASEVKIVSITLLGDSLYAIANDALYAASTKDNLVDYTNWNKKTDLPGIGEMSQIVADKNRLFLLRDSLLYTYGQNGWKALLLDKKIIRMRGEEDRLLVTSLSSNYIIKPDYSVDSINLFYGASDILYDKQANTYWFAYNNGGIGKYLQEKEQYDMYNATGPATNIPYRMRIYNKRLYVVPGERWAVQKNRPGLVMIYENGEWTNIFTENIVEKTNSPALDFMNVAVDPQDENHFYITSYGTGLYEFRGTQVVGRLTADGTAISAPNDNYNFYTRLDGAIFDEYNNLWFASAGGREADLYVKQPSGTITALLLKDEQGYHVPLYTPQEILIDSRYPNYKWIAMARSTPCFVLYDDNGTPTNPYDDKNYIRKVFHDQRGSEVTPSEYYCYVQDLNGDIWIGTNDGPIIINSTTDFRTSDLCERMIIYRTDGSSLGDYLLKGEIITAIAVDGANRKWVGTESSGVFLLEETTDVNGLRTIETIHHFTTADSPLPSNKILSIAINQQSGEVFIGTATGLVSYQSDAAEAAENMSEVYAYPNPVREDFDGLITITGLMENSNVNITDVNGGLVARLYSLGGLATWDGRNGRGVRVRTGVYSAQCVSADGKQYALVKILVIN